MEKAVILARGLGTRMRRDDNAAELDDAQRAIAETGVKAMIPIDGRPFLDYVLSNLADAGYRQVCLIVAPDHDRIRQYYEMEGKPTRIQLEYAVQPEPRGTANAVQAAEAFAGDDPFLVINSDNYYPSEALTGLRELSGNGTALFHWDVLVRDSNIEADSVSRFSVARIDGQGHMEQLIEKPDEATLATLDTPYWVSMNCWRFTASIFEACRNIQPSARGEYEIPDAVQYVIETVGEPFAAVRVESSVLDMTSRRDIASVKAHLGNMEVHL